MLSPIEGLQLSVLIHTEHIRNAGTIHPKGMRFFVIENLLNRFAGGVALRLD